MLRKTHNFAAALAIAAGAAVLGFPGVASAEGAGGSLLDDTLTVSLGTFLLDTKTKIRIDGDVSTGDEVDFGRDLGFKDSDRFRLDGTWRFAKRHKVRLMYFGLDQTRTATIDREITVGDTTFPVDGEVRATNKTTVLELAYEYVFMQKENFELTGTFGLHAVKFEFGISGEGTVNGVPTEFSEESADTTAPLPVLGVRALWQFYPQWYLDGQAQFFKLKYDPYDGRITDVRIGVTRMFGDHWGVGAGWNSFTTTVGVEKDAFDGELKWRYSGGMLFVTGSF